MSEKSEQKLVVEWCKANNIFVHAIPAVSFTKRQGGYPSGYVKGMPDLFIPRFGMYIEMKDTKAGKVKEHELQQDKIHAILKENDCLIYKCYGANQAIEKIKEQENDIKTRIN